MTNHIQMDLNLNLIPKPDSSLNLNPNPDPTISINICENYESIINESDYKFIYNKTCYFCMDKNWSYQTVYASAEQIVQTCKLCNILYNFNKYHMGKIMLCETSLTQKEIILQTHQFITKYNRVPLPTELDSNAK